MTRYGWPLIISALLVVFVHFLFNTPLTQAEWYTALGLTGGEKAPIEFFPFFFMYIGWIAYSYYYMWLYKKIGFKTFTDAVKLSLSNWLFIAFPLVAVHYVFLNYTFMLIIIDATATLFALLAAGNLLWALSIYPDLSKKLEGAV